MTVCIAARCGGAIVAAADSMLTAGDVQFEPPSGLKIQHFSNLAFIMTAGDAALSAELVQESGQQIRNAIQQNASHVWLIKEIVDLILRNTTRPELRGQKCRYLHL
jgi:ATP-dependent protease HslVU (ClpYQ) peptidase subunit